MHDWYRVASVMPSQHNNRLKTGYNRHARRQGNDILPILPCFHGTPAWPDASEARVLTISAAAQSPCKSQIWLQVATETAFGQRGEATAPRARRQAAAQAHERQLSICPNNGGGARASAGSGLCKVNNEARDVVAVARPLVCLPSLCRPCSQHMTSAEGL